MFPKSPFFSFMLVNNSSEPAVDTALVPFTVELAELATALLDACANPDK